MLRDRLRGAVSYDRIAGYFRSSLFEVAGEELEAVDGPIRIVCNSDLDPEDVKTAVAAKEALRRSWCAGKPEELPDDARPRIRRLYDLLTATLPNGERKLQVKVLPDAAFGLVHGKAGLVRYADGRATSFLGSVNESATAWRLNYELLWEDDAPEAIAWVQEEFDHLWHSPDAVDLACCPFVEADVLRVAERRVIGVDEWRLDPAPAAVAVESPLYRREQGLWPHQKYFANLSLARHRMGGARLVLADQVGLGKTIQLAMAALLMAMEDDGPILVLAPKPLLRQWQGELLELLQLPSARWSGSSWIDEHEIEHPAAGVEGLRSCPRRIGLVSQGLITHGNPKVQAALLARHYVCVIVDEAHRARRSELPKIDDGADRVNAKPDPNNLMRFLLDLSRKTKSMLLATATPVQLHPVEAWDLLRILAQGSPSVLGQGLGFSPWWKAHRCLELSTGAAPMPEHPQDAWNHVRDPLPSRAEDPIVAEIRDELGLHDDQWSLLPEDYQRLPAALRGTQVEPDLFPTYAQKHNPLLRCIVRRSREYLENTLNPDTKQPWLQPVRVRLFGEGDDEALALTSYLSDAYEAAEEFTEALGKRIPGGAGFFRTLLLRRLGSSLEAGKRTIRGLLGIEGGVAADLDDTDEESDEGKAPIADSDFRNFSGAERKALLRCLTLLEESLEQDPKLEAVLSYLLGTRKGLAEPWRDRGCILFSQYFDTAFWMGERIAAHPAFAEEDIGLYAGSGRSGIWSRGTFRRCDREVLKAQVRDGTLRLLLGTDAASEGLNLQRLGTLIHIDLPWNPTRLEQRKGRIQRIGQRHPEVWIANLRYSDSVEDRVHQLLSQRLQEIHTLFGQIPDTLEDAWVQVALGHRAEAARLIDRASVMRQNPFDEKYSRVEDADWESSPAVLDPIEIQERMKNGW
nr:phospholipase D-like domain-containing anti-phage protein [Vulgatibacter incomptus]